MWLDTGERSLSGAGTVWEERTSDYAPAVGSGGRVEGVEEMGETVDGEGGEAESDKGLAEEANGGNSSGRGHAVLR